MKSYRIDKESLVIFCKTNRKDYGHYTILGEHLAFYPFLQTHFRNHLPDLLLRTGRKENEITLADVHDRLCSRGGLANTEKQRVARIANGEATGLANKGREANNLITEKQRVARTANLPSVSANSEKQRESGSLIHSRAHENLKRQVLAAKKDYAIVTCRYCKSKEYFFLWSEYEERMSRYEMDSRKPFRPCNSSADTKIVVGCTECRKKIVCEGGPWKVVKVLVSNGNESGREVVIE